MRFNESCVRAPRWIEPALAEREEGSGDMSWDYRPFARAGVSAALLITLTGCDLESLFGLETGELALTGQNAFVHLAPEVNSSVPTDMQALMAVFDAGDGDALPEESAELLLSTARRRNNIDPENFQLIAPEELQSVQEKAGMDHVTMVWTAPNLSSLPSEYVIPRSSDIPMRNQANRGTCAAFAGVATLEYSILRDYPEVSTIDFSEQRFYYTSKPECQATGCGPSQGGSAYYTGFRQSMMASTFDIPLEADCPYSGTQTSNELQVPQAAGCSNGAAQINTYSTLNSVQEIVSALDQGFAVTWASPLSDNWMYPNKYNKNGIITYADSAKDGSGRHAGGHAYLLVGYKKLTNMPNEGGMCFIVKNSWGTGWGINGFACMTLRWMQEWSYDNYAPAAIIEDYQVRAGILPDRTVDPNDQPWDNLPDYDDPDDETIDRGKDNDNVNVPDAPVENLSWSSARLRGPDGQWYRGMMADVSTGIAVRGRLRQTGKATGTLQLTRSGSKLYLDGEAVGELNSNEITLCTGAYDPVCGLRFDASTNSLYVEFLYPEYRPVRESQLSGGEWKSFNTNDSTYGFEVYRPGKIRDLFTSPVYVRLKSSDASSDPIRLALKGLEIQAMGRTVGSLNPNSFGLCTGDYRGQCSLYRSGSKLLFLPN